jgi:hypothetical protein
VGVCFFEMSIEVLKVGGSVVLGVPHTVSTSRSRPAVVHGSFKVVEARAWGSVLQVADALGAASSRRPMSGLGTIVRVRRRAVSVTVSLRVGEGSKRRQSEYWKRWKVVGGFSRMATVGV